MRKMKAYVIAISSLVAVLTLNVQSIFAASVTYWAPSFLSPNGSYYSNSTFDMTSLDLTINGYQYLPGFSTARSTKYQIVVKGFFSDDVKGEKIVTGYYPKDGTWFNDSIHVSTTFTPPKGVTVKITNLSSVDGDNVSGNGYQ
ncbi:hypothetical protein [Paenibacillus aestuarii]|uniref:Uncharacterized protein n=1 Tax=Paenibacillus aestuarii TaxID=516965 RepID=A0ABW0K3U7_9BACL|nr:hypothetical protein [Paenibacillus aestuarii]